jgi:hypothetical protein
LKSSTSHTLREFEAVDGFYLLPWGRELHRDFPFLTLDERSHPYELFYQIWKLSYLFGRLYSDVSISFENVVSSPEPALRKIFGSLAVTDYELSGLLPLVSPVTLGKWRSYAADEWFATIEERVDQTFEDYALCLNRTEQTSLPAIQRGLSPLTLRNNV